MMWDNSYDDRAYPPPMQMPFPSYVPPHFTLTNGQLSSIDEGIQPRTRRPSFLRAVFQLPTENTSIPTNTRSHRAITRKIFLHTCESDPPFCTNISQIFPINEFTASVNGHSYFHKDNMLTSFPLKTQLRTNHLLRRRPASNVFHQPIVSAAYTNPIVFLSATRTRALHQDARNFSFSP